MIQGGKPFRHQHDVDQGRKHNMAQRGYGLFSDFCRIQKGYPEGCCTS